jgi:hypothetical protein
MAISPMNGKSVIGNWLIVRNYFHLPLLFNENEKAKVAKK